MSMLPKGAAYWDVIKKNKKELKKAEVCIKCEENSSGWCLKYKGWCNQENHHCI